MGDHKRSVLKIADMDTPCEEASSMSKKMKPSINNGGSGSGSSESELEFCSSGDHCNTHLCEDLHEKTVSPASSMNSDGTVVSGEILSCRSFSCCSSNVVVKTSSGVVDSKTTTTTVPDLEAKRFEIAESTSSDIKLFSDNLFTEYSGDSEETMTLQVKSPPTVVVSEPRNIPAANIIPPKEEIEEFFATAEKYEQERFAKKYNYDIAKDVPLDGRYEWVRLN